MITNGTVFLRFLIAVIASLCVLGAGGLILRALPVPYVFGLGVLLSLGLLISLPGLLIFTPMMWRKLKRGLTAPKNFILTGFVANLCAMPLWAVLAYLNPPTAVFERAPSATPEQLAAAESISGIGGAFISGAMQGLTAMLFVPFITMLCRWFCKKLAVI